MKKTLIPACIVLALALVIIVGSQSFLSPCVHEDGSFGSCHWAGQALLGLGCALGIQAVLALILRGRQARLGVYLSMLPVCAAALLTPGTLISLCRMATMRCQAVMKPAMLLMFSLSLLAAVLGCLLTARGEKQ